MMKIFKLLFFNSMIIGTLIAISAHSWISSWIGLEINLLSLIPLLKNDKSKFPTEAALKYFITQTLGSSIFIFSVMIFITMKDPLSIKFNLMTTMSLTSAILLKIGAAPFHFWLPEVMSGLNWINNFILMTWQKIAPITLLSYTIKFNTQLLSIIIITSTMISGFQGLNQTCIRKILAYSSINHISWLVSSLFSSSKIGILYFIIYCIINMNIILILSNFNIFYLSQLMTMFSYFKKMKFFFMLNFLSLGGLPPFLGFLPKWLVINNMVNSEHYSISSLLIIFTLISLYFYLRITFSSFTIYSEESLIIMLNKNNYIHFMMNFMSLSGLLACTFTNF